MAERGYTHWYSAGWRSVREAGPRRLAMTVLFLLLGTFMDPAPAMLIFVPVLAGVASTIGADPLQLGILIIMALAIGKITPPYGISLLLACTIARIPLSQGLGWTLVFFGAFCALMLAIVLFPAITLWLPELIAPDLRR